MSNARLLHAAARGARIQLHIVGSWLDCHYVAAPTQNTGDLYRIHPDDAHLAYGPISSELRKFVEVGHFGHTLHADIALKVFYRNYEWPFITGPARRRAEWCALLLAEQLADEGM